MAYDEHSVERVKRELSLLKVTFEELKMMAGLCIKVDGKMLCSTLPYKQNDGDLLMARIGEPPYKEALKNPNVLEMHFTKRPMKGFIFVKPSGYDMNEDLSHWIKLCVAFSPLAKASKKKIELLQSLYNTGIR